MKYKECKCGNLILKDQPRCGDCEQTRLNVAHMHQMEPASYRDMVRKRHKTVRSLVRMRGPVDKQPPEEDPKPDEGPETMPLPTDQNIEIIRLLQRKRILAARRQFAKARHENVGPALREWYLGEE